MPDQKGNLYLFEAIELRNEYDRHIKLIENLIGESETKRGRLFHNSDDEGKEPAAEFNQKELEETYHIQLAQIEEPYNKSAKQKTLDE